MKFARAMSNGVGLHYRDLTAGTPVYTPDELGLEDPTPTVPLSRRRLPARGGGAEAGSRQLPRRAPDLTEAALEGGCSAATVVELCRFFYDQSRPAELDDAQAVDMAGRLRLARVQGVDDKRLRRMAAKGLSMDDRSRAREAADIWLTFRAADTGPQANTA